MVYRDEIQSELIWFVEVNDDLESGSNEQGISKLGSMYTRIIWYRLV